MRYRLALSFFALFALGCGHTHAPKDLGSVLIVKPVHPNKPHEWPAVFERNLSTGKIKLLISAGPALKGWKGWWPPEEIEPSPDGQYIYLFVSDPEWCGVWSRESGHIRSLGSSPYPGEDPEYLTWMPEGNSALIGWGTGFFNARTGKTEKRDRLRNETFAVPSGAGNGAIVVTHPRGQNGCSDVYFQHRSEKPRFMFRWLVPIEAIVQSPDGRRFAVADTRSCYVTDAKGKQLGRFGLRAQNSLLSVTLKFNDEGTRLAAQANGQLWIADAETGRARRIDRLMTVEAPALASVSFDGIEGWLGDGKSIVISSVVHPDERDDPETSTPHFMFWSYDTTRRKPVGRLIFDSAEDHCELAVWYRALGP